MKRFILILVCLICACSAQAQYYVYQVTGDVSICRDGVWEDAYVTRKLSGKDLVRTGDRSCVVILDRKNEKVYSFQSITPAPLEKLVNAQSPKSRKLTSEVCQGIYDVMFRQGQRSRSAYEMVSGATYRGEDADRVIASALAADQGSSEQVSFRLVAVDSDDTVYEAKAGQLAVVEVTNHADIPLYFNLIDIDSEGSVSVVMPFDEYQTMLHLYIPPRSVIRYAAYPIEFYEPAGVDNLVLAAYHEPFNLNNVLKLLPQSVPATSEEVFLSRAKVRIH